MASNSVHTINTAVNDRQQHNHNNSDINDVLTSGNTGDMSSVLNKDVKQFGKQFLIDGKEDTSWNSDQV
ncbi:unnamed protein product, partial [Oppiella nova]